MKSRITPLVLSLLALALAGTQLAYAQATRTWVSGVGDDANPCSRTAPCKTFAGAISKTAPGGEINVLDPGGFGGVTINKSITISSEGFEAGVLVSGTNGIIVSVPNATDIVVLRGLDIEGLGTGLSGIKVLTGGTVYVEKCTINHFQIGIDFETTVAGTKLQVVDSIIRNNIGAGATNGGIFISPTGAGTVKANINHTRLEGNTFGAKVQGNSQVSVSESVADGNFFAGLAVGTSPAILNVERSIVSHNSSSGGAGIVCSIAGATVRLGNNSITDNNGTSVSTGGTCQTFKNNDIDLAVTLSPINPQ